MNVRELIVELLDCDLDAEVSVVIDAESNMLDEEVFYIVETEVGVNNYVSFIHEPKNFDVVDKNDYQDLIDANDEMEDRIKDLEEEIELMEEKQND